MDVSDILVPERVICHAKVGSKKKALDLLSELLAANNTILSQQEIFESLLNREKLGTTSLGFGVALPHGRQKKSDITLGAFIQLEEPIDYDAVDNQKVDLLFALLVPHDSTDQHLQLLAALAEMFNNEQFRTRMRSVEDNREACRLLGAQGNET